MATLAVPRPIPSHRPSSTIDVDAENITPPPSLESSAPSGSPQHTALPNKHIPVCPTGPAKFTELVTPPSSPGGAQEFRQTSLLYPPKNYAKTVAGTLAIYEIVASQVAEALHYAASQSLPAASCVFPWLHGLHPLNHLQQTFFTGRRGSLHKPPSGFRAVTLVKADGDLANSRLKGAIGPDEIMNNSPTAEFVDPDPTDGFSVRNFHIQTAKMALVSDIIVYGDDVPQTRRTAWNIAAAQKRWREQNDIHADGIQDYNCFVCVCPFSDFERQHSDLVAVDAAGCLTGQVLDLVRQERREMWDMTLASEISHNVYMGPTPEPGSFEEQRFDILIECSDLGKMNPESLKQVAKCPSEKEPEVFHEFPSSGSILPPTYSQTEADGILNTCKWLYHISHGTLPDCEDIEDFEFKDRAAEICFDKKRGGNNIRARKILIHCADGYTESSMLGIAYFSYSTGLTVPDAWLNLHTTKLRNFFAYPTDVALLKAISPRLLCESPKFEKENTNDLMALVKNEPGWFCSLDGSLPSRVLDYLYLGNLGHANNPALLREMGIGQVLSVGETASWREGDLESWGEENVCVVQGVQDNGIDPLTNEFKKCFEFIDRGKRLGTATLVHCRVGVSRSATICIAEVMRALRLSFPRAYCFVRARRLNVIIQPHLRFVYELLQWEEAISRTDDGTGTFTRELEWAEIARDIALMNKPYSR
ncbi:tyrosine/serine/threonine protein phosphatase pps1 [Beauveria asiatica]|uniref:Tyrosine/serine/threonine protein phosphatase pps1 n=1 Tax=Beauveria asiatica TaxID=1069075 RepID=A0AAW0RG61_9HYPO